MAGADDLKFWRSEPLVKDYIDWHFKRPYLGKWWSTDLPFARDWGSAGNLIYELDLPYPLADKKTKTVLDLLDDLKTVKNYTPVDAHGFAMGDENLQLVDQEGYQQRWEKKFNRKLKPPLITKFEQLWKNPSKYDRLNIVTPEGMDANRKINFWEYIKRNFKPTYSFLNRKPRITEEMDRLRNLSGLPRKLWELYKLKQSGTPMHSGINWKPAANLGIKTLRTIGGVGNVVLGGQALLDVYTESDHTGNMARDTNRMLNFPTDREGNVIRNINKIKNLRNVAQRDVLNPNEMRGVTSFDTTRYNPREMNAGGIASLVL